MVGTTFRSHVEDFLNPDSKAVVKLSTARHTGRLVLIGARRELEEYGANIAVVRVDRTGNPIIGASLLEDPETAYYIFQDFGGHIRSDKAVPGIGKSAITDTGISLATPVGEVFVPHGEGDIPTISGAPITVLAQPTDGHLVTS